MAYTDRNFKTKKALKEAVAARMAFEQTGTVPDGSREPQRVTYYQPGPFGANCPDHGTIYLEGPHYPQPHRWYARCEAKDGQIVKVS